MGTQSTWGALEAPHSPAPVARTRSASIRTIPHDSARFRTMPSANRRLLLLIAAAAAAACWSGAEAANFGLSKAKFQEIQQGDSRQLLDQWMPQPMWEMIDSVQRQQTADQNGAYFDGPGYCYEVIVGNRQDGAEVTKMPKIVTSGLALMKCIAFTNAVYSPYNVYQDLKKFLDSEVKDISWSNAYRKLIKLPGVLLRSLLAQPLRTYVQLKSVLTGGYTYLALARA